MALGINNISTGTVVVSHYETDRSTSRYEHGFTTVLQWHSSERKQQRTTHGHADINRQLRWHGHPLWVTYIHRLNASILRILCIADGELLVKAVSVRSVTWSLNLHSSLVLTLHMWRRLTEIYPFVFLCTVFCAYKHLFVVSLVLKGGRWHHAAPYIYAFSQFFITMLT